MKKTFIIFFIYIFQFNFAIANTTIAYIDMDKIISTSKPGSYIVSQLKEINSNNSKIFESNVKKLKDRETKLISQKNILSDEQLAEIFKNEDKPEKTPINKYPVNKKSIKTKKIKKNK